MFVVLEFLKEVLGEQMACDEQDIEMETRLDDLNLAEEDRTELALALSDHYGVTITDEQAASFETVEDVVACVEDQL